MAAGLSVSVVTTADAAPNASVTAGAAIPVSAFAFVGQVRSCTHHVATTGNDASTGTSLQAAWRTPAKAMALLQPGQTACVHTGSYSVATLDPARSGTASAPIALVAAPGESRPVLHATTDRSLFNFGPQDAYWVVQGFDLDKAQRNGATVQVLGSPSSTTNPAAGPAHHIAVRSNVIRNGKSGAAVLVRGSATDVLVEGNTIRDHHRWESGSSVAYSRLDSSYRRSDANAVNLEGVATGQIARVRVQGNDLHHNGGDGLQCLGVNDDLGAHTQDPADLDLVDNRIHHNVEDAVDIKSCQRVSIRGSRSPALPGSAANNKLYGYRPTDRLADKPGNHSGGGAIVIHYFARKVLVENTRIWDACRGISIGRADKNGVQDIIVRRNLIFGLVNGTDCPGNGLNLVLAHRVDIYHNTFTGVPGTAVRLATDNGGSSSSQDIDVFNNILETTGSGYWIDIYQARLSDFETNHNLFWHVDGSTSHFKLDFNRASLDTWRSSTTQDAASRHGNPLWITQPMTNDYYTQAGSPARDAAQSVPGTNICGTAADLGFRESGC